ncbi:MAG TPA: metallophosphoesterase family protein [Casimicrobiaceae bacterium]|nr:metallophosphoesterase family protein [Casimicrobiaceae bacterium]
MNARASRRLRVGLVSDTHGLLRPEAVAALRGSAHVIHAGDIGDAAILRRLSTIAPVTAVRGNNDVGDWADAVPPTQQLDLLGTRIYVIHDLGTLDIDPAAAGIDVVVSGHSHRPQRERREGVLYVNPGSAGPRRFRLPIAVGILTIDGEGVDAKLLTLDVEVSDPAPRSASRAGRRG